MKPIETDGPKSSQVTDHPFTPRTQSILRVAAGRYDRSPEEVKRDSVLYPPNPWLCECCGLAEAAHATTTLTEEDRT